MGRRIRFYFILCALIFVILAVCACGEHEHKGGVATCTERAVCEECGEEYGEPTSHDFSAATCTEPKSCKNCIYTEGEALGHKGGTATCTDMAICDVCSVPYGLLEEHSTVDGVCILCHRKIFSLGLEYALNSDGMSYSVTGLGSCTDTDVLISAEYEGLPVTCVGYRCFSYCQDIRSVVIPEGVTYIDLCAFESCRGLVSITLPSTLTEIHASAFDTCVRLAEVINHSELDIRAGHLNYGGIVQYAREVHSGESKIVDLDGYLFYSADGVNYLLDYTGDSTELVLPESFYGESYEIDRAFYDRGNITSVTLPEGLTRIGESAFAFCYDLTNVTIQGGVTSIGDTAFLECQNLVELSLPDGVLSIGELVFTGCENLRQLSIPDSVTRIGCLASHRCDSLEYNEYGGAYYLGNDDNPYVILAKAKDTSVSSCVIHSATKIIGTSAFNDCAELASVTIPDGVLQICGYAFYDCSSLVGITFPDTVESIGIEAFSGCSALSEITLGNATSYIGDYAFSGCDSLGGIEYGGAVYISSRENPYFALLKAKDTSVSSVEIHPDTRIICSTAFRGCSELSEIVIPNGVTAIGRGAFMDCASLLRITLPDSVEVIEGSLFVRCTSLTEVTLGDEVGEIKEFTFMDCEALSRLIFGPSVKSVGYSAFEGCPVFDICFRGGEEQWQVVDRGGGEAFRYSKIHYNYVPEEE